MGSDLEIFCRQIRHRSRDNKESISLLVQRGLIGPAFAVLRQELDSLIRCIFILAATDRIYRSELISYSVNGVPFRSVDGKRKITDREMVEISQKLHGWTRSVYDFGCAFIHLSNFHDFQDRNPLTSLHHKNFDKIKNHLAYYHGIHINASSDLTRIGFALPCIFEKISSNIEFYLEEIVQNGELDAD